MKISLICVGAMHSRELAALFVDYAARIGHFMPFDTVIVPDVKSAKAGNPERQKADEARAILQKIDRSDFVMLLDERGREMSSPQFAEFISRKAATLPSTLAFVVGGPFGFGADLYSRADAMLSLSKMVFPHEVARVLIAEQIYRAMTIIHNRSYHH